MSLNGENELGKVETASMQGLGASIEFPALAFSQGLVYLIHSLAPITQCTRLGFKKGFYDGLVLVDSDGNRFQVAGARKLRRLPFKLQFGDFLAFLEGNPRWQVDLVFAPGSSKISLDELKKLIFDSFKKQKYSWEAMSDLEEFRDQVATATSLEQVFSTFKRFNIG